MAIVVIPMERKCLMDGLENAGFFFVDDASLTVFVTVKPVIAIASTSVWETPAARSCALNTAFMASGLVFTAATFASTTAA